MRGVAFWVLDAHAQRAVSDPREKNLASLSPEEQATLAKSKELLTKKYHWLLEFFDQDYIEDVT